LLLAFEEGDALVDRPLNDGIVRRPEGRQKEQEAQRRRRCPKPTCHGRSLPEDKGIESIVQDTSSGRQCQVFFFHASPTISGVVAASGMRSPPRGANPARPPLGGRLGVPEENHAPLPKPREGPVRPGLGGRPFVALAAGGVQPVPRGTA